MKLIHHTGHMDPKSPARVVWIFLAIFLGAAYVAVVYLAVEVGQTTLAMIKYVVELAQLY